MDFFLEQKDEEMAFSKARIGQNWIDEVRSQDGGPELETVTWDDVVKGLGLRNRGGKRT